MFGLLLFVLLASTPMAVNVLLDFGSRERRRVRPHYYGWILELVAEFETAGGRVQEIDDNTGAVRRLTRLNVVGPWVVALILSLGLTWLGLSMWVAASVIGLWAVGNGATTWLISERFGIVDGKMPGTRVEIAGGIAALGLKGLMVAAGVAGAHAGVARLNDGDWQTGLSLVALAIGVIAYSPLPVRLIDRRLQRRRETDFARTTKTDAVLFLRSFKDDDLRMYSAYSSVGPRHRYIPGRQRFEELVLATLFGRSELVGVGAPGERLPMLGASRTYWDHDNWKDAIRSTASRTDGLLVMAGKTPSLNWELTQLRELGLLGKTLVLFPPADAASTLERYERVADALAFEQPHRLPDELKIALTAVAFDPTGHPIHYLAAGRDWSSYVATLVHFQLILDGELQFEAEGAVAEATAMAEDPFHLAAYLLDDDKRELAEEILRNAAPDDSDPSVVIGRAWERVALHGDAEGARQLLMDVPAAEEVAMVRRALKALDAARNGGEHRAILRARYPEPFQDRDDRIRRGTAKLDRLTALGFQRLMQRIGAAEEAHNYEAACAHARDLLDLAESIDISTLIAMARGQLGDMEMARGDLDRAESLLRAAASLRDAPRVTLSKMMPRLDPVEVVDDALTSLAELSGRAKDGDRRNAVLRELLEFRTSYGTLEDAAGTAEELACSYAAAGDVKTAIPLFDRARADYMRAGRLAEAGWMIRWLGQAEADQDNLDAAVAWANQALAIGATADDAPLRLEALRLAASAYEKLSRRGGAPEHRVQALAQYEAAVSVSRELVEADARSRTVAGDARRDRLLSLSKALIDLGSFLCDDPAAARPHYEDALSIRRALVAEVPGDYGLNRRAAYARLYLAINARQLGSEAAPKAWRDAVGDFATLASAHFHETATTDLAFVLKKFLDRDDDRSPTHPELEAVAESMPSIRLALQRLVEHADPDDAYGATRDIYGLADAFRDVSSGEHARPLYADVLAARRDLSSRNPGVGLYRRGVGFALLTADIRHLPDDADSALGDFREAISIFEELASTSSGPAHAPACADLLTGLCHAGRALVRTAPAVALEFADRAAAVARDQLTSEPMEPRWKEELALALELASRAARKFDAAEALRRCQALLALDRDDGYPAWPRWSVLVRAAGLLEDDDPHDALRHYETALRLAESQLNAASGHDWGWELGRTLAWTAEIENTLNPPGALTRWRECIAVQEQRAQERTADPEETVLLAMALNHVAALLGANGFEGALESYRRSEELSRGLAAQNPTDPERVRAVVEVSHDLATFLSAKHPKKPDTAAAWARNAQDLEALASLRELTAQENEMLAKARAHGH